MAETEDEDEGLAAGALPPDLDRYISPGGLARFKTERDALRRDERPRIVEIVSWAAGNGDRSENGDYQYGKRRLREIDRRLRFLERRIRTAIPVPAALARGAGAPLRVRFGAKVTYAGADEDGTRTVTILGVDEADLGRGEVSLLSPIGRALLGTTIGDEVRLQRPGGSEVIEVLAITYSETAA